MAARDPGFNLQMFKSRRSICRALRCLGYGINERHDSPPIETVQQFQQDFNKCSDKIGRWEKIAASGILDVDTLNALERAVQWAKDLEGANGTPSARSWQSLCSYSGRGQGSKRAYSQTKEFELEKGTNFVEILPSGIGKLRNTYTTNALRCSIIRFERHGDFIFAVVEVPPQGDLPSGRNEQICCPCLFSREGVVHEEKS